MSSLPGLLDVVVRTAKRADLAIAIGRQRLVGDKPSLTVLVFHAIARDERELDNNCGDPWFRLTLAEVRQCIEYYLRFGYTPVSPADILRGLRPGHAYVMFTFDDGYFNNSLVLPYLECERVPALFAITTDYVDTGKGFWWDVVFRHCLGRGMSTADARRAIIALLYESPQDIEVQLVSKFGSGSLEPTGDLDRPFTARELRAFAQSPYVFIANHTAGHEMLGESSQSIARQTFARAQAFLEKVLDVKPITAVYPFGVASGHAVEAARGVGLTVGFTTRMAKQPLPIKCEPDGCMLLPRMTISRGSGVLAQCERYRLDWLPSQSARSWYRLFFPQDIASAGSTY